MRGDLAKVPGITEIETDIANRICKFKLAAGDLNLQDKLDELSKTNDHIAGFTIESTEAIP